ncbi:MAG: hypothetical protein ACJAW8_002808 [Oleispira sp.]|jgi:hypothetical protein
MDKPAIKHFRVNIFLIIIIKLLSRQSFALANFEKEGIAKLKDC